MNWRHVAAAVFGGFLVGLLVSTATNLVLLLVAGNLTEGSPLGAGALLIGWIGGARWIYRTRGTPKAAAESESRQGEQRPLTRGGRIAIGVFIAVAGICIVVGMVVGLTRPEEPAEPSEEATERIRAIMLGVMQDPDSLTPEAHSEFWEIIDREHVSDATIEEMREFVTGYGIDYQRLFYQDALISYRTGIPRESSERLDIEKRLGQSDELASRFRKNRDMLEKISNREPILGEDGAMYLFDDAVIKDVLQNLDAVERQLDLLLTRPK